MSSTADVHNLAGAYVVDAVSETERAAFEHHLDQCDTCAQEVAELRAVVTHLAVGTAEVPPPQLRDRVLAAVTTTRQSPPVVPALDPGPRSGRRRLVLRVGTAVVGAAAAAAVVFGLIQPATPTVQGSPEQAAIADVRTAPDAETDTVTAKSGATATAVVSRGRGRLVLTAAHLPTLDRGHVYQVWLIGPRGPQSAGLLHITGPEEMALPADLPADVGRIGITAEPVGGSPQPTTPNVISVGIT